MTNAALQAMITEFGNRMCIIVLDNTAKLYIGYPGSNIKNVSEITLKQYGDTDMFGVKANAFTSSHKESGVTAMMWYPTSMIQAVCVMDATSENYRMDPFQIG